MNNKRKVLAMLVFFLGNLLYLYSCEEKQYRYDEIIHVPSEDTTIMVKISYPEKWIRNDKIIIWSNYPLADNFLPDSMNNKRDIWMSPILRKSLLDSGYINIEYLGRNDSIVFVNRKYSAADSDTKATDLENILKYIHSNMLLKDKRIILIGYSEGGDINSKIASKGLYNISAMLQLACSALSGTKENAEYQHQQFLFKNMLRIACHGHQENMDKTYNKLSSLDRYHTADMEGTIQFIEDNIIPVDNIIYKYKNMDSVYYHLELYLRDRWQKEDQETKDFHQNDYNSYYMIFAGSITPQQITLKTNMPEYYYPHIKCLVLAVQGTKDERIDCFPNIERMKQLLSKGCNNNFQTMVLEDYKHNLAKWNDGEYYVEDDVIHKIIKWIDKQ